MLEQPIRCTRPTANGSLLSAMLGNAADITNRSVTPQPSTSGAQNMFNSMMEGGKMLLLTSQAYQDMANPAPQWAEDQQNNFRKPYPIWKQSLMSSFSATI